MIGSSLLDAIGNTPLIRLNFESKGTIFAKLEYLNPGGSVKDRSARYMIEAAEQRGDLKPGGTLIDASSGNQGVATAMIGAAKGYKVIITVSEKVSLEKMNTIKAYGAEVIICPVTDFVDDPRSYHSVAVRLQKETPNSFMPNQYYNVDNAWGHYYSLGPEIWRQTEGKITHFFSGAGTGGTISGAGRYLKEQNKNVQVIATDSVNSFRATKGNPKPYKIEGIGVDFVSPVLDYAVIDAFYEVHDKDAFAMLKALAHQHGLLVGPSSGAIACAVAHYASRLKEGDVAIMICGDSGRAYLSKNLYI
jgi:cystathionine beta-synthase